MKLQGAITALITPFINDQVDAEALAQNIRFQIENGITGIVPLGTTGEASTQSKIEQELVIKTAVKEANGKVPVIVGTGSYCTKQTIEQTKKAKELGADMALIVTPYYNKPTQEGVFRHYEEITKKVDLPIIIYNIPGRCSVNIETATLVRIAQLPNVVGVKESSGNINQAGDVIHKIAMVNPNFSVLSGDDALTLPMMSLGASGVVSVVSNLMPRQVVEMVNAALTNDYQLARQKHHALLDLFHTAFIEANPGPIKKAMELCGMKAGGLRLPLYKMEQKNVQILHTLLTNMGLAK